MHVYTYAYIYIHTQLYTDMHAYNCFLMTIFCKYLYVHINNINISYFFIYNIVYVILFYTIYIYYNVIYNINI